MNNDTFLIEDTDLERAHEVCKFIEDIGLRNRATANAAAAEIANKYFVDLEIDTKTGLHNVAKVLEKIEISDIYVKGAYIDVRFYFEENELCVPKSHFDKNLLPVAYMFIKLNPDLSGGAVSGFILSGLINTVEEFNGYYKVTEEELVSFYDIEPHLVTKDFVDMPDGFEASIYDYLDNNLEDENAFYQVLLESVEARERLLDASNVKDIFRVISINTSNNEPSAAQSVEPAVDVIDNVNEELLPSTLEETSEPDDVTLDPSDVDDDLALTDTLEVDVEEIAPLEGFDTELQEDVTPIDELGSASQDDFIGLEDADSEPQEFGLLEETDSELQEFDTLEDDNNGLIEFSNDIETSQGEEGSNESFADDTEEDLTFDAKLEEDAIPSFAAINFDEITIGGLTEVKENDNNLSNMQPNVLSNDIQIEQEEKTITVDEAEPIVSSDSVEVLSENEADDMADLLDLVLDENDSVDTTDTPVNVDEKVIAEAPAISEDVLETEPEETASYSTTTTPSINEIDQETSYDELEEMLDNEEQAVNVAQAANPTSESEDVNSLFNTEEDAVNEFQDNIAQKPKGNKLLPTLGVLTFIAALGYFGYTKFIAQEVPEPLPQATTAKKVVTQTPKTTPQKPVVQDAMPVETVENIEPQANSNEGNAISIPAIEQNLDASVVIENLTVNWEVPASYLSNNMAKRYFFKLGKIIQLHLKTELLLLDKTPITNKITAELEFKANTGKFAVKKLVMSSGVPVVDNVIKQTIQNALDMNFNTNMSVFNNLAGNPVLIIKL